MNLNLNLLIHSSTAVLRNNNWVCVKAVGRLFFGLLLWLPQKGVRPPTT
jgi:hypothetical protein